MKSTAVNRRDFLQGAISASAILGIAERAAAQTVKGRGSRLHVSCTRWTWATFYARENLNFDSSLESGIAEVKQSGFDGFEPNNFRAAADVNKIAPLLKKNGLEMRSIYVDSAMHTADIAEASMAKIVEIAGKAKDAGTRIVITNPSPLKWGSPEDKDDGQLRVQAEALDKLGAKLRSMGLTLAYHNHNVELRSAAREFHHMMLGTNPENLSLCLDAHWIYRGSGNSSVALFDIVKLYGKRISVVHVRQSIGNIWSETVGDGDIDYRALAQNIHELRVRPEIVIEQGPEKDTPKTMSIIEALRISRQYMDQVFG